MNGLLPNGCWAELHGERSQEPRPCLFLDRDGVVIVDKHHLRDPEGVEIIAPTAEAIAFANRIGWAVGLVTNQSGIGQGFFVWEDFHAVQARLVELLAGFGARLDFTCACPFHPQAAEPYRSEAHPWRKPAPGMIDHAATALNLDKTRSIIVGDRQSDLDAGVAAGLAGGIHFSGSAYHQTLIPALPEALPNLSPVVDALHRASHEKVR
jgi:D-glycero-D-manno-heptose 1,7-bisphosphate phosphatase